MKLVETHRITPATFEDNASERLWVYCGLDTCLTLEIFNAISPQLDNVTNSTYRFSMDLMAPTLEMSMRGVRVDIAARDEAIALYQKDLQHIVGNLNTILIDGLGLEMNWNSPAQLKHLFYDIMGLPTVNKRNSKGEYAPTVDKEALEKLYENYFVAKPIISHILAARDISKKISTLSTDIDEDNRWHTSYNIGGTSCVSGDSLVLTRSGLQPIEKLYNGDHRCQLYNEGVFYCPNKFLKVENAKGFHITTLGGYELKCSANHPILTQRGFIRAEQLNLEDRLILKFGIAEQYGHSILPRLNVTLTSIHSKPATIPIAMSRELCEFIGMWLADGSLDCSLGDHFRVRLSNEDLEVTNRFRTLGKSLFNVDFWFYDAEIGASSEHLIRWLVELGLPANLGRGTAKIKEIPQYFLSAKSSMLRSLIRGLTLDSHFTDKGLAFGTQSPKLQNQIQQILLLHGIEAHKVDITTGIRLQIPRAYLGRYLAMFGFVQSWKLQRAAEFLNSNESWHEPRPPNTYQEFEVKFITEWTGDVYDLTMPKESKPQYLANGIVVHNTGRLSSSFSELGTGGNFQNLTERLRRVFIADPGMKLAYIDLEQAESRAVGAIIWNIFHDGRYLDSCEGGDLHSTVAKIVWPELSWTGDPKRDREIAEQPFLNTTRRQACKVLGHGSNYQGQPITMSKHTGIPVALVKDFQAKYIPAFGLDKWHAYVERTIREEGKLTSLTGRRRHFFGRRNDPTTIREAVAFDPQGSVADILNTGMLKIWRSKICVLLAQLHDAVLVQYPEEKEDEILPQLLEIIKVPVELLHGRTLTIPSEAQTGWNWSKASKENPDGLIKYHGHDSRQRSTKA